MIPAIVGGTNCPWGQSSRIRSVCVSSVWVPVCGIVSVKCVCVCGVWVVCVVCCECKVCVWCLGGVCGMS